MCIGMVYFGQLRLELLTAVYEYPSIATGVLSESHYGAKLYLACLSFVYTILFRPAVIAFLPYYPTVSGSLQYFYLYQPACSSVQYPIPKNNNNNNTTDITISSAACIYRACLSHYINSIHPTIHPSVGLSVYLACLLSSSSSSFSSSHRPQRGASSLLVILLLCEPHSKEEYRRHDDDWRMSRRRC